jgi:hypothetical protein
MGGKDERTDMEQEYTGPSLGRRKGVTFVAGVRDWCYADVSSPMVHIFRTLRAPSTSPAGAQGRKK